MARETESVTVSLPRVLIDDVEAARAKLAAPGMPPPSRSATVAALLRAGLTSYAGPVLPSGEVSRG